ncbi:MAG: hypothetical protein PUC47_00630 [Oscillospiraceae bacterium]|nr:hypothetical protein [Oscillospiraceae bacterium]
MSSIYYADQKAIDLDRCPVVYSRPFSEASLREDFEAASGSWSVTEDGWLTGLHRDNSGGMLYTRQSWPFDTLVEFDARAVPPCCNDLNFVLKTCGWDAEKGDAGRGYIAGLGGWWLNKAGIEKYPSCQPRCLTSLFPLETGRVYHIVAGAIEGHCFFFVDGQLVVEMTDPHPEDFSDCGKVGFGTYASHIQYRNLVVYKAAYTFRELSYTPEF